MNGFGRYRKTLGLTQTQVADALGVDRSTIARAERGQTSVALMQAAWVWSGGALQIGDFAKPTQEGK